MHAAEIEALERVVGLILRMLDGLQAVDDDRHHLTIEFRSGIVQPHGDLRACYGLAHAEVDELLAGTVSGVIRVVKSGGVTAPIGIP